MTRRRRVAHRLVGLYPFAWRERYAAEFHQLIEDRPEPGLRAVTDVVRGAVDAHLHPAAVGAVPGRAMRLRLTLGTVPGAYAAFVVAGAGYQKAIEDPPYAAAASHHPLVGIAYHVVQVAGFVSGAVLVVGALPLAVAVWRRARAADRRDVLRLFAVAPIALGAYAVVTGGFIAFVHHVLPGGADPARATTVDTVVFLGWVGLGVAALALAAWAPSRIVRRFDPGIAATRRAFVPAAFLAALMLVMTVASVTYVVALAVSAPSLLYGAGGPTAPSMVGQLVEIGVVMGVAAVVASTSVVRALRAS